MSPSDAGKHAEGPETLTARTKQVEEYGIPKQHRQQHYDKRLTSARAR